MLPLYSLIGQAESGNRDYDRNGRPLRSPKGAMFGMQVMPATARDPGFGIRPAASNTPDEYNRVGRDYLDAMSKRYGGDTAKIAGAYNWGPGNLDRALGQYGDQWAAHAPAETQSYVQKVTGQPMLRPRKPQQTLGAAIQPPAPMQDPFGPRTGPDLMSQLPQMQAPALAAPEVGKLPGPKFFSKDGAGKYVLAAIGDAFAMHNMQQPHAVQNLIDMNTNERAQQFDREKWAAQLEAQEQARKEALLKPYRFQNNAGDVVDLDPASGQSTVRYVDPYQKPDWAKIENPDGSIEMRQTPSSRPRPTPESIAALRANPDKVGDFDALYGPGMARYVLGAH